MFKRIFSIILSLVLIISFNLNVSAASYKGKSIGKSIFVLAKLDPRLADIGGISLFNAQFELQDLKGKTLARAIASKSNYKKNYGGYLLEFRLSKDVRVGDKYKILYCKKSGYNFYPTVETDDYILKPDQRALFEIKADVEYGYSEKDTSVSFTGTKTNPLMVYLIVPKDLAFVKLTDEKGAVVPNYNLSVLFEYSNNKTKSLKIKTNAEGVAYFKLDTTAMGVGFKSEDRYGLKGQNELGYVGYSVADGTTGIYKVVINKSYTNKVVTTTTSTTPAKKYTLILNGKVKTKTYKVQINGKTINVKGSYKCGLAVGKTYTIKDLTTKKTYKVTVKPNVYNYSLVVGR